VRAAYAGRLANRGLAGITNISAAMAQPNFGEGNINESNKPDLKNTLADALKEMFKTVLSSRYEIKDFRKNKQDESRFHR
jgi:predicted GNAT superfamily acetyltransferase